MCSPSVLFGRSIVAPIAPLPFARPPRPGKPPRPPRLVPKSRLDILPGVGGLLLTLPAWWWGPGAKALQ